MRVYFLTPQTHRDYELLEASEKFFRWLVRGDGADHLVSILRLFAATDEEFGGLGGVVEPVDDLTRLADVVRMHISAGLLADI